MREVASWAGAGRVCRGSASRDSMSLLGPGVATSPAPCSAPPPPEPRGAASQLLTLEPGCCSTAALATAGLGSRLARTSSPQ